MDFTYLSNIITHLSPLLTRALPLIGTSLLLGRFYSLIKK